MASRPELPSPASGQIYESADGEMRHVTWVAPTPGGPRVRWRSGEPERGLRYGQASLAEWLAWVREAEAKLWSPPPPPGKRPPRRRVSCNFELDEFDAIEQKATALELTPAAWVQKIVLRELKR